MLIFLLNVFIDDQTLFFCKNHSIIVTYEKAVRNGFHRADIKLDGTVVFCEGFTGADVDYFIKFTIQNGPVLESLVRGEV